MPSRANASLLQWIKSRKCISVILCQCPHGLMPHCYLLPFSIFFSRYGITCQCPHGLMPHCYDQKSRRIILHKLCQCPHGLMPHCYVSLGSLQLCTCPTCQCPHGLMPHCYHGARDSINRGTSCVNALTG